ncbi:hypothetical protein D3C72_1422370 [compost metagenome]
MCLGDGAGRAADAGTDIDHAQFLRRHAQLAQGEVLGQRKVLAVAGALGHAFQRCRPVVRLPPQIRIFNVLQFLIKELIYILYTVDFIAIATQLQQQLLPVAVNTQRLHAVQLLHPLRTQLCQHQPG